MKAIKALDRARVSHYFPADGVPPGNEFNL